MKKIALYFSSFLFLAFTFIATQWKYVPENASIKFFVKEKEGYEEGVMKGIMGSIKFDKNNLKESHFTAIIDVKTINTGVEMRDESLRSSDFFEVSKYPLIKFESKEIIKNDSGYCAKGNLIIKKIANQIEIPFQFFYINDTSAYFKGQFTIDRYQYGVGKKGDGVGNIVRIELNIPVKK